MMMSDDKVGGWVKKGQNHDDVILECPLTCLLFHQIPCIALEPSAQVLVSRVSNGTGFSCPSGQRDRSLFIVPRQRDNGTEGRGPWNADGCRHKGGRGQISGKICQRPLWTDPYGVTTLILTTKIKFKSYMNSNDYLPASYLL